MVLKLPTVPIPSYPIQSNPIDQARKETPQAGRQVSISIYHLSTCSSIQIYPSIVVFIIHPILLHT